MHAQYIKSILNSFCCHHIMEITAWAVMHLPQWLFVVPLHQRGRHLNQHHQQQQLHLTPANQWRQILYLTKPSHPHHPHHLHHLHHHHLQCYRVSLHLLMQCHKMHKRVWLNLMLTVSDLMCRDFDSQVTCKIETFIRCFCLFFKCLHQSSSWWS